MKSKFVMYKKGYYLYSYEPKDYKGDLWISVNQKNSHSWFWQVRFYEYYATGTEQTLWEAKQKCLSKLSEFMSRLMQYVICEIYP